MKLRLSAFLILLVGVEAFQPSPILTRNKNPINSPSPSTSTTSSTLSLLSPPRASEIKSATTTTSSSSKLLLPSNSDIDFWTPRQLGTKLGSTAQRWDEYRDGVRVGPPPDLPSLLLHNRIVYIGMPLVPAVTELIIAELLYLNYESTKDDIAMYINSSGTTTASGQAVGYETEAFAIADVMKYIRPKVQTIAIGQAFGAAAMLLSQGTRGMRYALPNATIMLNQPKSQGQGQATDLAIRAREIMHNRRVTCELIAQASGKPIDEVVQDCARVKYLQPDEAVEYGLIDKVISTKGVFGVKPSFMRTFEQEGAMGK